jgi:ribosomal protein L7/L12
MDIQSEKIELIKMLLATTDASLLEAVRNVFETQQQTVWTELSPEEQEQIEIKIQEDNRGDQLDL